MKIYVAGSGGKTSLIHYLAEQYRRKKKKSVDSYHHSYDGRRGMSDI